MTEPDPVAEASTTVPVSPDEAFRLFTADIGTWWKPGSTYWNDAERGLRVELEPGVGGRFREIYAAGSADGSVADSYEIGRVTTWQPGERLALTWREDGWEADVATDVDITFQPVESGTLVTVRHSGWERVGGSGEGYGGGWAELLGWFAEDVTSSGVAR